MTLREMREKQARLVTEARSKLAELTDKTDASRAAEIEAEHDAIMNEHDALEDKIKREEKLAAAEARQAEREAAGDDRRPNGEDRDSDAGGNEDAITYRQAFQDMFRAGGVVADMSAEARAVLQAGVVANAEFRQQVTSTDAAGGFTVPTELQDSLIKSMAAWGPMYDQDVGTTLNTASGSPIELPTVDDTASTAGAHTEGADLTDDGGKDVVLGKLILNAFMYDTEFIRFSMELARDSLLNFEQILSDLLGERLGRIVNQMLTTGSGAGQPNGIVTASGLGITGASGTAITSDELFDLQHEIDPAYRASPKVGWMFNDSTLKVIRKMKDGQGNYLWQMGDVKSGAPATLLSQPYRVNQAMADIGLNAKPIIFGDFGKYYVRKVGAPVIGVLRERFWPNLGIAGLIAVDGELGDTAAVKHLKMAAA